MALTAEQHAQIKAARAAALERKKEMETKATIEFMKKMAEALVSDEDDQPLSSFASGSGGHAATSDPYMKDTNASEAEPEVVEDPYLGLDSMDEGDEDEDESEGDKEQERNVRGRYASSNISARPCRTSTQVAWLWKIVSRRKAT